MKDEELNKLYKDCLEFWGYERQLRMLQEECAELILEASHYLRPDKCNFDKLVEELADVQLMVNQLSKFVGEDKVKAMMDVKSEYINEKLQEAKEKVNGI